MQNILKPFHSGDIIITLCPLFFTHNKDFKKSNVISFIRSKVDFNFVFKVRKINLQLLYFECDRYTIIIILTKQTKLTKQTSRK